MAETQSKQTRDFLLNTFGRYVKFQRGRLGQGWFWTWYLAERGSVELQGFQRLDFRGAASAAGRGARGLDASHGSGLVRRNVPGNTVTRVHKGKRKVSFCDIQVLLSCAVVSDVS